MQDVRFALRSLRKSPGFTAAAVLALTVGIGASTSIFSVLDGVLFRPLAFPESELRPVRSGVRAARAEVIPSAARGRRAISAHRLRRQRAEEPRLAFPHSPRPPRAGNVAGAGAGRAEDRGRAHRGARSGLSQ